MAVLLLMGSRLMIRTFVALPHIDPGFRAEDVLTMEIAVARGRYPDVASVPLFYEELCIASTRYLPVRSASPASRVPRATEMGD